MVKPFQITFVALALFTALAANSCANVHQIDRGRLAKRMMQIDPAPHQEAFRDEVHTIREGAAGGTNQSAGGGCGCN